MRRVAEVTGPATGRKLTGDDLDEITKAVTPLPEARRKKIIEKVTSGKVHTSAEVKKLARAQQAKLATKQEVPPDLMVFIMKWTGDIKAWTRKLKARGRAGWARGFRGSLGSRCRRRSPCRRQSSHI